MNREKEALQVLNDCFSQGPEPSIRRRALAQRAWIYYRAGKNEAAFQDFEGAAKLGCSDSKKMAIRCNPYAQLCNEMLIGVLKSENKRHYSA
jgi:Tfp pilus assembly protein PilF